MKKVLKFIAITISALLGLVLVFVAVTNLIALSRLNRQYDIGIETVAIPEEDSVRERGEHLIRAVSICTGCHGEDLGGEEFINAPFIGQFHAPNLTPDEGGKASQFSSEDWVRALRHGVNQTGRPLLFMPSQHYNNYSDEDLGAIIAYLETIPPVDRETPPRRISVIGRTLLALDVFGEIPAEEIDHNSETPPAPPEENAAKYGEYLVTVAICKDCHGENLAGGEVGPGDPFAPNLTQGGELIGWAEEDFFTLIRTGVHPTGRKISTVMPWESYRNMTDTELRAIWRFLQELPALPNNE